MGWHAWLGVVSHIHYRAVGERKGLFRVSREPGSGNKFGDKLELPDQG